MNPNLPMGLSQNDLDDDLHFVTDDPASNSMNAIQSYKPPDGIWVRVREWKKRFGEDVEIKMCYVDGVYYKDKPAQWFGETERFRVGPCAHVDDVFLELTRLYSKPQ